MQTLHDFYGELIGLFAHHVEVRMAFWAWSEYLKGLAAQHGTSLDAEITFGRGDPNAPDSPESQYQYRKLQRVAIQDSQEDGCNIQLHRHGLVALAYALWEDKYRERIAVDCGLPSKDGIESDVFRDLNLYRQAVLHANGQLDRDPKVMRFLRKGDAVSLTKQNMEDLFSELVGALNHLGRKYYCVQNPGFTLNKPLGPQLGFVEQPQSP